MRSGLYLSIRKDVISMSIFVSEFSNSHRLTDLPFINRRLWPLFLFPFFVDQKGSVRIWFFSYSEFFLKHAVIFAFRILGMINSCEAMRMTRANQSIHSLFFESSNLLKRFRFIFASQRISFFILDRISFKFEFLIRTTSQLQGPSTHNSLLFMIQLTAVKEIRQSHLFAWNYRDVRYEGK